MKFNSLILIAIFSFFLFSCDSGLKFDNPLENNPDANNQGNSDAEMQDEDSNEQTDTEPTDSEPTDTEPDNPDSTQEQPDNGDSEPDNHDTDDSDSAPDNADTTPDDDTDTSDSTDDSGDSEPDDTDTTDDGDTSAPDKDDNEPDEEPTTRTATCSGLPANASWHNGSSITQTFDGNDWYPPATGFYSETAVANECGFKCNQGYEWNGDWGKCFIRPAFGNICTGQTNCYNNSEEITCPTSASANFYGQDAQYAKLGYCYPQNFTLKTVSGNKVVVDNNTGLVWEQSPSSSEYTWENRAIHCNELNSSNYAGINTWRVPNPMELLTIVDNSTYNPATNSNFTGMPIENSTYLWTNNEHKKYTNYAYVFSSSYGWYYAYHDDSDKIGSKINSYKILCVSGSEFVHATLSDFTTSSDGKIVTDNRTGLIWQKEYKSYNTWQEALAYCQSLNADGYGGYSTWWHLPNKNELASLLNLDKSSGSRSDFPDMPSNKYFWSSSTRADNTDIAWSVDFNLGSMYGLKKTNNSYEYYARCVRSERINDLCENHICGSMANSTGVCIPENAFEYSCACDNGYFWNGNQCKIMPECSASSGTPCKDSTNHLIWSPLASNDMTQPNALNYCENLVIYGFSDWHLPTIDDLRTLIKNCPGTETNGACAISEKNGKLSESDSSSSCSCAHMNNNGGYYSKIGDDDTVSPWSSSSRSDDTERAWYVGFFAGKINNSEKSVLSDVRCVRNVE